MRKDEVGLIVLRMTCRLAKASKPEFQNVKLHNIT